jgi:hypothetical protein
MQSRTIALQSAEALTILCEANHPKARPVGAADAPSGRLQPSHQLPTFHIPQSNLARAMLVIANSAGAIG